MDTWETDTETDKETDTKMDMKTDTETDTETEMDTDMELEYFDKISARHYTSRRNFQQRYKLVAPLLMSTPTCLFKKNSYRHWDFSPNDVLAKLEI